MGTEDVMVLPALSVVVTAVLDVGVLDDCAEVPVSSSFSSSSSPEEVCEGCSEVGEAEGDVVPSSLVEEVVGPESVVVGAVVGSSEVVVGLSEVVGAEVVALVS